MKLSWVHSISPQSSHQRLESSRATWAKPVRSGITRWSIRVWSVPSGFIKIVLDVCPDWAPLRAFSCAFLWGWFKLHSGGDDTSSSPPLAGSQTWWPVPPWSKVSIRGTVALPYSKGSVQGWGSPESYSGVWGILVHPSPPVQAYLWTTSFIGRIFPGLHRVGVALVQAGFTGLSPDV